MCAWCYAAPRVLGDGELGAGGALPNVLIVGGMLRDDGDAVRDQVHRVEAHAELPDQAQTIRVGGLCVA